MYLAGHKDWPLGFCRRDEENLVHRLDTTMLHGKEGLNPVTFLFLQKYIRTRSVFVLEAML